MYGFVVSIDAEKGGSPTAVGGATLLLLDCLVLQRAQAIQCQ
jgi:hypothetical protein